MNSLLLTRLSNLVLCIAEERACVTNKYFSTSLLRLAIGFVLLQGTAQAQELVYKIYSPQQLHGTPLSVAEDSIGFTLILTDIGLVRFNGIEFKTLYTTKRFTQLYQTKRKGSVGLADDGVYQISSQIDTVTFQRLVRCPHPVSFFEDQHGDWWIQLQSGKMLYSHAGKLDSFSFPGKAPNQPVFFWSNAAGQLYLITHDGRLFYPATGQPMLQEHSFSLPLSTVHSMAPHNDSTFWVASHTTLYQATAHQNLQHQITLRAVQSLNDSINNLYEDPQNHLYLAARHTGLYRIDLQQSPYLIQPVLFGNQRTIVESFPLPSVESIYKGNSVFWLIAGGNLVTMHTKPFYYYFPKLSTFEIGSITQSAQGVFYFGSVNEVLKVTKTPTITEDIESVTKIPQGSISTIEAEGNRVWIGNSLGQLSYLEKGKWHPGLNLQNRGGPIFTVFSDSRRRVWFCQVYRHTPLPGISYTDSTLQLHYFGTEHGLSGRIISVTESPKGAIFAGGIGDHTYLYQYNETAGKFENLSVPLPFDVSYFEIHDLSVDEQDNIWLASTHGLLHYTPKQKKLVRIDLGPYFTTTEMRAVKADSYGQVWVATDSYGLICYRNGSYSRFVSGDGMPSTSNTLWYRRLLLDNQHRLWVGSNNTYATSYATNFRPEPTPAPIILSLEADGKRLTSHFANPELNHQSDLQLRYTCLSFPPGTIEYQITLITPLDSQVVLTPNPYVSFPPLLAGNYTLQIRARQSGYAWSNPTRLQFSVQPIWYRRWWAYVGYLLALSALVGGLVRLQTWRQEKENQRLNRLVEIKTQQLREANQEVIAQNEELLSQQEEISLQSQQITIQYEQLQDAQQVIEHQNQTIRKRNKNLEKEVAERTKELVEYNQQLEQFAFITAHNLRAPVARIQGLGQLLEMAEIDPCIDTDDVARKLIRTAYDLDQVIKDLNSILEIRKNSSQVLIPVNLYTEIEKVTSNLRKEMEDTNAQIQIQISPVYRFLSLPAYIDSILYNLISNAIKYRHPDRNPEISIKTTLQEQTFCLEISDNGLGMDLQTYGKNVYHLYKRFHFHVEGKGLGLYLVKTQVTALGGRIELESQVNQGTRFLIYFPMEKRLEAEKEAQK